MDSTISKGSGDFTSLWSNMGIWDNLQNPRQIVCYWCSSPPSLHSLADRRNPSGTGVYPTTLNVPKQSSTGMSCTVPARLRRPPSARCTATWACKTVKPGTGAGWRRGGGRMRFLLLLPWGVRSFQCKPGSPHSSFMNSPCLGHSSFTYSSLIPILPLQILPFFFYIFFPWTHSFFLYVHLYPFFLFTHSSFRDLWWRLIRCW